MIPIRLYGTKHFGQARRSALFFYQDHENRDTGTLLPGSETFCPGQKRGLTKAKLSLQKPEIHSQAGIYGYFLPLFLPRDPMRHHFNHSDCLLIAAKANASHDLHFRD